MELCTHIVASDYAVDAMGMWKTLLCERCIYFKVKMNEIEFFGLTAGFFPENETQQLPSQRWKFGTDDTWRLLYKANSPISERNGRT